MEDWLHAFAFHFLDISQIGLVHQNFAEVLDLVVASTRRFAEVGEGHLPDILSDLLHGRMLIVCPISDNLCRMKSDPREFKLGNLHGIIDAQSGQLRYLMVGQHELLRGIYGSVRRPDWGTVNPVVSNFKFAVKHESLDCSFTATHKDDEMDFTWEGKITGRVVGGGQIEIEYELVGTVPSDQKTNRLGLCLLHPATLAGVTAEIEHTKDGSTESIPFPEFIKPDQPFLDTKAITYELGRDVKIRIELSGDNFETEDQRNYGDASYKTYCHWQSSGSPYPVKAGQVISQRAKLIINPFRLNNEEPTPNATEGELPSLGTLYRRKMSVNEMEVLMGLHLSHAQTTLEGMESAKISGGAVFFQSQMASVPAALSPNDGLLFSPVSQWKKLNMARGARKFYATQGWFMEFNSVRPPFEEVDGMALGLQPKTHQMDSETMMECGWVIPYQVNTARHLGAKTIIVGPVRLSDTPDERTTGMESALLTIAAIANSVKAKAEYATLFDAETLLKSPAALPLTLLSDRMSNHVRVWDVDRQFVMIECGKIILANFSWEPSELFKKVDFDSKDNLQVGIKGEYHLFDESNIRDWRKELSEPAKHSILSALPPRSIVVLA